MNILFYRYGSICEPDMIAAFQKLNINVVEITEEITEKKMPASRQVELVSKAIDRVSPVFVFSINFFPAVAEVCHLFGVLYLCWTVDAPVLELFSQTIRYGTNRIFLFDRAQYEYFHRFCPGGTFHLPLASAVERFDKFSGQNIGRFSEFQCNISFVGSLYSEKSPLSHVRLSDYISGYIDGICEASQKVYGSNFMEEALNEEIVQEMKAAFPEFLTRNLKDTVPELEVKEIDRYVAAHYYVGYLAAQKERIQTLNMLAKKFQVDLFTGSDVSVLENVRTHGRVNSLTEMPVIFRRSKINLNMTIKPIQKGLPLRIFDIMGCRGFLMTNYQEELTDLFEIGVDLEAYASKEELMDKCAYYLTHETERAKIALNGYEKVKQFHSYEMRIGKMLRQVLE